ncbi:FixH family protein [Sphingobacterium detergens]|uniref:FixH protein n=1 Tax=Sphingobacterium detergens TaxID=1145106 RepID=A0A420AQD7_SPHD1|nr:FixH family protein [Sphingobacterium detergens]RKE46694.1 FixH protein [Sphingobacterium detergens]
MNWGTKIFLSLAVFMLCIVGAGVYMVSHNSDSLEEDDYYEQGLNYDQAYEKKQNVLNMKETPTIELRKDTLYIHFVSKVNRGKLLFRKPSDNTLDKELPFQTTGNLFTLPISSFDKGMWNLYVDWESAGKDFLFEEHILF